MQVLFDVLRKVKKGYLHKTQDRKKDDSEGKIKEDDSVVLQGRATGSKQVLQHELKGAR